MKTKALCLAAACLLAGLLDLSSAAQSGDSLTFKTRRRAETSPGKWELVEKTAHWKPAESAIVVCDMWDDHWCKGASRRVAELAPRMNEVVKEARKRGVRIIHAPSDTMKFYEGTQQRENAKKAPPAKPPKELTRWMSLDSRKEGPLPIDDSDGGCDDEPTCKQGPPYPWTRQIATIEVFPADYVSSDGQEIYNVMKQHGINNVIVMGVHANMCVLGRPFSIRQLVGLGKNVLLMRDMTDTMYNSRAKPFVSHFKGTDLVVEHIEKYWCPSITSDDIIGGKPFRFKEDKRKLVAFIIGEEEYNTKQTLAEFAAKELPHEEFESFFVHAQESNGNNFPGLETLKAADLLVISVRRRTPSNGQLDFIRQHIREGKPVLGIRTASHAFDAKPPDNNYSAWPEFDAEVLGYNYGGHFGNSVPKGPPTIIQPIPEAITHPIMSGVGIEDFKSTSHLYKNTRAANTLTPLLNGHVEGKNETHPVAWVHTGFNRKVFYTSLGNEDDFKLPAFRKLLRNGIYWSLDKVIPEGQSAGQLKALSPAEAEALFKVPDDLEWEQVLAEPIVRQPVFLNFDERGRMWVVQYLQYPHPAGLKMVSKDNFWRTVYDKVPAPPPNHERGADKITIHEDTDGDGKFDKHKTFVDGLNIATAVVTGRGGAWVLNPPYLLFYPDKNGDDEPDSAPEVRLRGFGLEDTHSVVNSLRWGPDGWLYAAQGSTVTASITQPGTAEPVNSMGQLIWRYHPETRRYEVFSEGGGNAFGVEIDAKGRIFSGHNGGNTRGFHYAQGAYLQKGFEKHGPLSNPYAYGYFPPMPHPDVERFTHNFIIYESNLLPAKYHGKLFGVEPLQGRVVLSEISSYKSSFKTRDLLHPVTTSDPWFKPVDIKEGPDGAIYVCDWYDRQVNHFRNHEGQLDTNNGRIYRLNSKGAKIALDGLEHLSSEQLAGVLKEPSKWRRQMAINILYDRQDKSILPLLETMLANETGQTALEALWALNACGGFDAAAALKILSHPEPFVRLWTIRLIGDQPLFWDNCAGKLEAMASKEPNVEVRGQLASTAGRLPAKAAIPIIHNLLKRSEDASDNRMPLLIWWALERHADAPEALAMCKDREFWREALVHEHITSKLMRRFAQRGTRQDLLICARLLELSPSAESSARLLQGFETAYRGRSLVQMPEELSIQLAKFSDRFPALALRTGSEDAIEKALALINDSSAKNDLRDEYIEILGDIKESRAIPILLNIAGQKSELASSSLAALQNFNDPVIGTQVTEMLPRLGAQGRLAAISLLSSRPDWALNFMEKLKSQKIDVPPDIVQKLKSSSNSQVSSIANKLFPKTFNQADNQQAAKLLEVLQSGVGNPYEGKKHYAASCAPCHKLFGQGGEIGPDLTPYKRNDLDTMLLSVVSPSAEIREGYRTQLITTRDERSLSGFIAGQDDNVVVLRTVAGETLVVERKDITTLDAASVSLMPEGLLETYDDQGVRDLFAYLRSLQPLPR